MIWNKAFIMNKDDLKIITIVLVFLISIVFFILGITTPILSTKMDLFGIGFNKKEVNLIDSVKLFYDSKDYFLSVIILIFTFVLPAIKYIELLIKLIIKRYKNSYLLDKWNMLDVFIVALLLVNFKMGDSLIVMKLQLGTAFLSISVITRILVIELIDRWCKDNEKIINKQL